LYFLIIPRGKVERQTYASASALMYEKSHVLIQPDLPGPWRTKLYAFWWLTVLK
jgi:hypothetical protein